MSELIKYLLTEKDLDYVLTGNLQYDPIERRFGRYRSSAGTNYFISAWQILEAEKSIRIKSLVSLDGLNLSVIQGNTSRKSEIWENTALLVEYWHENIMSFYTPASGGETLMITNVSPPNISLVA